MVYEGWLSFGGNEVVNNPRARGIQETLDCPAFWLRNDWCRGLVDALTEPEFGPWITATENELADPSFEGTGAIATRRTNYNPNSNLLAGVSGWSVESSGSFSADPLGGKRTFSSPVTANQPILRRTSTTEVPALPGEYWMQTWVIHVPLGSPSVSLYSRHCAVGPGSPYVSTGATVTIGPGETKTLYSGVYTSDAPLPASTTAIQMQLFNSGALTTSSLFYVQAATLEKGVRYPMGAAFSGDTEDDTDFTYEWAGTVNASQSFQKAEMPTYAWTMPPADAFASISKEWAKSGSKSIRVTPIGATTNDSYISSGGTGMNFGMQAGKTYTAIARIRLASPQKGTIDVDARRIVVAMSNGGPYTYAKSDQSPNAAGDHELRLTFEVPVGTLHAHLRLWNGASAGNGEVWFDDVAVIEVPSLTQPYTGPYFDGDSVDPDEVTNYVWTGEPNASTTALQVRTADYPDPYTAATISQAPWYDPSNIDVSSRFYGVFALDVLGLEDSTRQTQSSESIADGGTIGSSRVGMKDVRVRAFLLSRGRDAMEYGRAWLNAVLSPSACGQHGTECNSTDLTYFVDCPPQRELVPSYGEWSVEARNIFPNPRATNYAAFGEPANVTMVNDFPDPDVTTALKYTRAGAGTVAIAYMFVQDADWKNDGSLVRIRMSVHASESCLISIWGRNSAGVSSGQSTIVANYPLQPGMNVVDVIGPLPTGGTPSSGLSGFTITAPTGPSTGSTISISKILIEHSPASDLDWYDGSVVSDDPTQEYRWEGVEQASPSYLASRLETMVPEPYDDWREAIMSQQRYLHGVGVVSGPFNVQEMESNGFVGRLVEWTFRAGRPWVYSPTVPVDLPAFPSSIVQDVPFNLVPYPSAEIAGADTTIARNLATNPSVEVNSTGLTAEVAAISGSAPASYFTSGRSTSLFAVGTASMRGRILGNGSTAATGSARTKIYQDITVGAEPAGTRISFNVWGAAIIAAGAGGSAVTLMRGYVEWRTGGGAVVATTVLGVASASEYGGRAFMMDSQPIPATATVARVVVEFETTWTSSATPANNSDIQMYADAFAVTVP